MRLKQKENTVIIDECRTKHFDCIMAPFNHSCDENGKLTICVGVFSNEEALTLKKPILKFDVNISKHPKIRYKIKEDDEGNLITNQDGSYVYTKILTDESHRGASYVLNKLRFMRVYNGKFTHLLLKDLDTQKWFLNHAFLGVKVSDYFYFEDGLLPANNDILEFMSEFESLKEKYSVDTFEELFNLK